MTVNPEGSIFPLLLSINNKELWAVVDTGEDATVVSLKMAEQAGIKVGSRRCKLLNAEEMTSL